MHAMTPRRLRGVAIAAAALAFTAAPSAAQLPNNSAAAAGMGGNYTAAARGYEAISWNPALLGLPGRTGFSLTLMPFDMIAGLDPVDLSTLKQYEGQYVPLDVRRQWLQDISDNGGQEGRFGGGLTPIALSIGNFGLQYSAAAYGSMNLGPEVAEAVLFGNAGNTGTLRELQFAGSTMDGGVISTVAASFAKSLPNMFLPVGNVSVGVTAKYIMGHGFMRAQDAGGSIDSNQVSIVFPTVFNGKVDEACVDDCARQTTVGSGMGLDVGGAWRGGRLTVGVSMQNLLNTFKWDTEKLAYNQSRFIFNADSSSTESIDGPYASAPQALRDEVEGQKFSPQLGVGVAFRMTNAFTIVADARTQPGEGIRLTDKTQVGVGAEYRLLRVLPIRAGVTQASDGMRASAGIGIALGSFELGLGTSLRKRGQGDETGVTVNLVSIR